MRSFKSAAVACVLGAAFSSTAMATDLSYNYAEFGYTFRAETNGVDGDGFILNGSLEIAPNILVLGRYDKISYDGNQSLTGLFAGAGYVHRMDPRFDLVGAFMIGRTKLKAIGGNGSDSGFRIEGGIRGIPAPRAEAEAKLVHINTDGSDTFIELHGRYNITNQISIGGQIELGSETDRVTLNVRYNFL